MNPILLARHVQESLRELVHTTLNTTSRAFEGTVDRFLDQPENFIKGPWVSIDMPFRQIDEAGNRTWQQPFPDVPLRFAPYRHQLDAFARLGGDQPRSTIVATGTGSGKTETYLWPILDHCRRHKDRPGIKAILIYPMNALATDQARRLASALSSLPSLAGVRAGIYADAEPEDPTHAVTADSIITHRETMRRQPPDILLTNYKMLDYLLLRARDKPLWQANNPETLRFLVVDEMHTFDGAQGADLALLLRRLKHRLDTPANHLVCVGSSATLGTGDAAAAGLRTYAETVFGETFDGDAVIRETRRTPTEVFKEPEYFEWPDPEEIRSALAEADDLDQPGAAHRLVVGLFPDQTDPDLAELHLGDPATPGWRLLLGRLLLEHHACQRILRIINEAQAPVSLDDIAVALGQAKAVRSWDPKDHRALAEQVISLVAWARSGSADNLRPLFNVRLQLWIREMSRMVADLPRVLPAGQRASIDLHHALDIDRYALKRMLPVVNCNRCGAAAHIGRQQRGAATYWAPLDQIYEEFFDDRGGNNIRLFYHESIDRKVNAAGSGGRIIKGLLHAETLEFTLSDHEDIEAGPTAPVWMYSPIDNQGQIDRTCPACGHPQGLLIFGMRAARVTTGLTGTLYTSAQNEQDPNAKPRFLMFSDSVQDAAHRAAIAETRNALSVCQKSLYQALAATGAAGMTLRAVFDDVPERYLEEMGGNNFTAQFIAHEQTWRTRYQSLICDDIEITDPVFLDHMKQRLGWEYFVDLTYRAHFSHTLEVSGMAAADVPVSKLRQSAEKLSRQLQNAFPAVDKVDSETILIFLAGVLQRMRRQGSVAHPYLVSAIATNQRGRGPNWFGAAAQMGLGRTRTLPAPDHRRGVAPIPVTLRKSLSGFESITRDHVSNWYRDWLFRSIGPVALEIATDPETVFPIVLNRLEADALLRRVDGPDDHDRHGWLVEPEAMAVTARVSNLTCTGCGRQETSLHDHADLLADAPCTRIGCEGRLALSKRLERPALRRALASDRNHRVVAREHTGVLTADDRRRIETGFIKHETRWAPNMISATPTLEMGIDIGDLSTMLLCSVPPEEANYVQRMGRSGRRDGNAFNVVLANARAHDLQFWEQPTPMLAGEVKTPGVFLAAEEVLLRQVTAFTLDSYVAATVDGGDYGKVREVLKRRRDGVMTGFPAEWLDFVAERGSELAEAFLLRLPGEVRSRADLEARIRGYLTEKDNRSLAWRIGSVFDEAANERTRLLTMREDLARELERLRRRQAELTEEEFDKREGEIARNRNEINRLIRNGIDDVPVLKYMTDKGVLPNYAFPEAGVKLTSVLSRRDEARRDEDGLLYLEYQRPASSALTEFAPGQIFYANGRQVKIDRIELSQDDLSVWTFCQACSHITKRHEGDHSLTCPKCGDDMWSDNGSDHDVIPLKSVLSFSSEDKAIIRDLDQRQQQQFDRTMVPFYGPDDIAASWYTRENSGAPFGFEFVSNCRFQDFNFGRKTGAAAGPKIAGHRRPSQPFLLCRHCGTLQQPARHDTDEGSHPHFCQVARDSSLRRKDWETEAFLMRSFDTEAIRVVIPVAGQIDDDDVKSFVAGINLGMRRYFSGKVDHIRSTVVEAQLDGMATVRSLFLYDSVPGGSGYLRQLGENANDMRKVIARAVDALRDCPCCAEEDKTGCYRCVKSYRSQFGPGEPDRDRARDLMEMILRKWENLTKTETGIDGSIRGALVESALEKRFLRALMNAYGDQAITPQVIAGGRRGFILRVGKSPAERLWTVEPQVQINTRFRGLPNKRVDFLLAPIGQSSQKPIVIEMDGIDYHAKTVDRDLLDRMLMIRSGEVRVWTLSWKDLDADPSPPRNLWRDGRLDAGQIGRLGRVLAQSLFASLEDSIKGLREGDSFTAFQSVLEGRDVSHMAATSVLVRSLVGTGRDLENLPRSNALTDEGRQFLEVSELKGHTGDDGLDLYLACAKIGPENWTSQTGDLRFVLRAMLPAPGEAPASQAVYTDTWRGLWRLVNLLQIQRGFHVEIEGLDTLSPPDMTVDADGQEGGPDARAWVEARALSEDRFHPLIDALIAARAPDPDCIGEDFFKEGRVLDMMMEIGWSNRAVAVAEGEPGETGWRVITFYPDTSSVGETVTMILRALEETSS